jgi:hypothetical protein
MLTELFNNQLKKYIQFVSYNLKASHVPIFVIDNLWVFDTECEGNFVVIMV